LKIFEDVIRLCIEDRLDGHLITEAMSMVSLVSLNIAVCAFYFIV